MRLNNAPVEAATTCIQCGYNLRELTSERCPECGWVIDWALARNDEDQRRPGTPAYRWVRERPVGATLATLGLMLFRPIRFARALRLDEPLLPAVIVAVVAYAIAFTWPTIRDPVGAPQGHAAYLSAIIACIACNSIVFALLGTRIRGRHSVWRRFRLFLVCSLYANCFVALWMVISPPYIETLYDANFLWPLNRDFAEKVDSLFDDWDFLARTVIFYWWTTILLIFVFIRLKPRWRAIFILPLPILSGYLATWVAVLILNPRWGPWR